MTFRYETTCANCGFEITLDILVEPEQAGGPETEYLPQRFEIENTQVCACEHHIDGDEEARILSIFQREVAFYGRVEL